MRRSTLALRCLLFFGLTLSVGCSRLVDSFLYQPKREVSRTPGAVGLAYEDLALSAADGAELHGWWVPGTRSGPGIAVFHGNAGNIAHRLDLLRYLHDRLGLGVLLFDYRGYGRSTGTPSEEGLYADARSVRALIAAKGWDREGLVLYGRSLGAAVALQSAAEDPPAGLVLEAPFTTLKAAARYHYPVLSQLMGSSLENQYDNLAKISNLECPVLFFHGDRDAISPVSMGWRLYDAVAGPKWFHTVSGAGHNNVPFAGGDAYWGAWTRFLQEIEIKARTRSGDLNRSIAGSEE